MPYLRILLIGGVAFAAYTLGARAGRGRYRTIKKNTKKLWTTPTVRAARKTSRRGTKKLLRAAHI